MGFIDLFEKNGNWRYYTDLIDAMEDRLEKEEKLLEILRKRLEARNDISFALFDKQRNVVTGCKIRLNRLYECRTEVEDRILDRINRSAYEAPISYRTDKEYEELIRSDGVILCIKF